MRNTVGMKGVVYGVNNPSLSTVYEVDSCRGGGSCFCGKYPWYRNSMERIASSTQRIPASCKAASMRDLEERIDF